MTASDGDERRAQGDAWPAALVPYDEAELVAALAAEADTYRLDGADPAAWAEYVAALVEEAGTYRLDELDTPADRAAWAEYVAALEADTATAHAELVELLKRDEEAHREAWAEYVAALKRDAEAVEKLLGDPRNMP